MTRLELWKVACNISVSCWGSTATLGCTSHSTWVCRGAKLMKSWTWADNMRSQPRMPTSVPWAASREAWPAGRGRGFCPFTVLWWDPTWSPVSSSGALSTRRSGSGGGPQRWSKAGAPLLWGKAERIGAIQPREGSREKLTVAFQYLKGT